MTGAPHPIQLATLDRPICFVGATGSGKTTAAKGAVEQLLDAGRRVVVIDPTGVWWGLRLRSDGTPGYPVVIFGGEQADVPIGAGAGERLGRLLAAGTVGAAIVDTSDLSTGETIALLTPFFEALHAGLRGALHLVVDEADAMAPQNPMPEGRRLLGVVDKIARRGRVKGFRPLWITQRPAVLNKNVLSQVSTLVAMQLRSPQDRKALESWIQGNADADVAKGVLRQLSGLPVGTGFVWAPQEERLDCVAFPPAGTFDSSRAPEPGEADAAVAPLGAVDVAALRAALAADDVPAEVARRPARRGETPAAGGSAQREPSGRSAARTRDLDGLVTLDKARRASLLSFDRGYVQGYQAALDVVERSILSTVTDQLSDLRRSAPTSIADARRADEDILAMASAGGSDATDVLRVPAPKQPPSTALPAGLNSAARKMRAVLDTNPPTRRSWSTVARLAGLKARGGHFTLGRKHLLAAGLVLERDGLAEIVAPSSGAEPFAVDPAALVDTWATALGGLAGRILRHLLGHGIVTRESVAVSLGVAPRGGHWTAAWKALRDNGLVDEGDANVRLSSLFRGE